MIIGIGNDIVYINRIGESIDQFGQKFINRCFTENEIKLAEKRRVGGIHVATYAKRFAAKEALVKALGCGFRDGITMQNIDVSRDEKGCPHMTLKDAAKEYLDQLTPEGKTAAIHLSLSDERDIAQAFVVIELVD